MGEYAAALDPLRLLLETYPESIHRPEAYYYLAITYENLSRWLDAADAYLGYLTYRPGVLDAFIYERRADALFTAGDYAGALLDYQARLNSPLLSELSHWKSSWHDPMPLLVIQPLP
jgi:tetratricopeptide (TPR) repeat protein